MAGVFFAALLAILTLAATAAGFAVPEFAPWLWILGGVLALATVAAAIWDRRRVSPAGSPFLEASGESRGNISDSEFEGYDGAKLRDKAQLRTRRSRFRR